MNRPLVLKAGAVALFLMLGTAPAAVMAQDHVPTGPGETQAAAAAKADASTADASGPAASGPDAATDKSAAPAAADATPTAGTSETATTDEKAAVDKPAADKPAAAKPAVSEEEELPDIKWSFDGVFGTYDRGALQRGFQIYSQVCSSCHSMDLLSYRNLTALGYSEDEVKAIAASHQVTDGPNDEGEMFQRPGLPSDRFVSPFPNKKAASSANNGAVPPDMSLLAKAREGGPNYIYGILTGFQDPPKDAEIPVGRYWNKYKPGHVIAMPPPLQDGQVAYEDGTPQTLDQYAKDVSTFLAWAAEPHMEDRKRIGIKVMLFLLVFTGLMYGVKKKVWKELH
jgi:ubiquinol-cytochrome c reductase cytochrome c1 subunit